MASGKAHEKINIGFIIFLVIVILFISPSNIYSMAFFVIGYIIGTFWMNPDLDIKSRPYNRWGPFKFFWKPYQLLGHRSILTHGILIGDIIRFAYLLLFVILISLIGGFVLNKEPEGIIKAYISFITNIHFLYFFAGNVISSAVHTITDIITTTMKGHTFKFWTK